jgi:hypothetical protein
MEPLLFFNSSRIGSGGIKNLYDELSQGYFENWDAFTEAPNWYLSDQNDPTNALQYN